MLKTGCNEAASLTAPSHKEIEWNPNCKRNKKTYPCGLDVTMETCNFLELGNMSDQEKSSGDNEQNTCVWRGAQRDGDDNGKFRVFSSWPVSTETVPALHAVRKLISQLISPL